MGVYGSYCTVEPDVLDAHRDDYAWWAELFEPADYEGRTATVDRLWDALWFVLDPARREGWPSAPSTILTPRLKSSWSSTSRTRMLSAREVTP